MEDSIPDKIQRRMFVNNGANRYFSQNMKNLIDSGNNEEVKSYIKGINPSLLVDSNKTSLLHLAAEYNNYDIAKYLIELKFDVNAEDASKRTPLIVAVTSCKFETAQVLIQANADMYNTKLSDKSVLQMFLNYNSTPKYLIDSCIEKVKSDSSSDKEIAEKLSIAKCPLNIVVSLEMPNVTRMFMDRSGQVDHQQCCSAMALAVKLKDRENVLALLQCGVGIDLTQIRIASLLSLIPRLNNGDESYLPLMSALLENVIDWSFLREGDVTQIEVFFRFASKNILQIFLQHNIHIHVKNKFPEVDLIVAIFGNRNTESRELLKHLEFDVEARDYSGFTALHYAASIGALAEVRTLLDLGANPNIQHSFGLTPLAAVGDLRYRYKEDLDSDERKIVELLLLAGADVQLCDTGDSSVFREWILDRYPTKSQLVLAQLAIDESLGTPIRKKLRYQINNSKKSIEAYQTFCQQIENLKATKVNGSVTLYDILVTDADKIANRIRDREIVQAITRSSDVKQLHFFYVSKLKNSVKKILHTMDLREKATAFICEVAGWPDSQYIILENILGFLTHKDLLVFDLL